MLKRISEAGLIPATEVLDIDEAKELVDGVLGQDEGSIMLWTGARNQNHRLQRDLGRLAVSDTRVIVGAKNQPWTGPDQEKHFRGIISHISDGGGLERSKILMIHRGFAADDNSGFRNRPDYDMALRIKEDEGIQMLLDPSHIGGTQDKVIQVAQEGMRFARSGVIFDGMMIEVHPDPNIAVTDVKQQLSWTEYDQHIVPLISPRRELATAAAD